MPRPVASLVWAASIDLVDAHRIVKFVARAVAIGAATGVWIGIAYAGVISLQAGFGMHTMFPNSYPPGTTSPWFVFCGLFGLCVAFGVLFALMLARPVLPAGGGRVRG